MNICRYILKIHVVSLYVDPHIFNLLKVVPVLKLVFTLFHLKGPCVAQLIPFFGKTDFEFLFYHKRSKFFLTDENQSEVLLLPTNLVNSGVPKSVYGRPNKLTGGSGSDGAISRIWWWD